MPAREKDTHLQYHFEHIGMVARWRPVHLGHVPVLRALCDHAAHALIGIGSANRYDVRNPFTVEETTEMIQLVLGDRKNYTLIPVLDLDDGPRWRAMIVDLFGPLDVFVTANPYVADLLQADYTIMKPIMLVPEEKRVAVDGHRVRKEMAQGDGWQVLVPPEIASYIAARQLDARFRSEFGLQTLALGAMVD